MTKRERVYVIVENDSAIAVMRDLHVAETVIGQRHLGAHLCTAKLAWGTNEGLRSAECFTCGFIADAEPFELDSHPSVDP